MAQTIRPQDCLGPARFIDSNASGILAFVSQALGPRQIEMSESEKAISLFNAVRDQIRYDPYAFSYTNDDFIASTIATKPANYCVPKAILLTACLRAANIPAAVGFADVRNHLSTPKLQALMGTDIFLYHGYVQLWLDNVPYKITPAFNMKLCDRFGVKPLIFDGKNDALFHEYNVQNRRHMEYINDHGIFIDAPVERIISAYKAAYSNLDQFTGEDATSIDDKMFSG